MFVHRYRIRATGGLGQVARDAFEGYIIEREGTDTALIADLDQAGLFGALARINALGLELIEAIRLDGAERAVSAAGSSTSLCVDSGDG